MTSKRDYGQFCGLAAGLNIIGERWTLLIIRELTVGPARFNEILDHLPGIGSNLLTDRLRFLCEQGVLEAQPVPGDGRGKVYRLTDLGDQLRAPLLGLARWGLQFLDESDTSGAVRAEWGFLAVQAMVDSARVPDVDEVYEFRIGSDYFAVVVAAGRVDFTRVRQDDPALTIHTDPETFVRIGARMLTPEVAVSDGRLVIDGDPDSLVRCGHLLGLAV